MAKKKKSKKTFYKHGGKYMVPKKYQTAGMYESNNIPEALRSMSTQVYDESRAGRVEQEQLKLEELQGDTSYMDEAVEEANRLDQGLKSVGATGSQLLETAAKGYARQATGTPDNSSLLKRGLSAGASKLGAMRDARQAAKIAKQIPKVDYNFIPNYTSKLGTGAKAVRAGATTAGTGAATAGTLLSSLGPQAIGAVADYGGRAISNQFDDNKEHRWNVGEASGDILSGAGKGASAAVAGTTLAASLGLIGATNAWNPLGWGALAGAAIAGTVGAFKTNKAKKDLKEARQKHQEVESRQEYAIRQEQLADKSQSGYDMGYNLAGTMAKYGGTRKHYQTGGERNSENMSPSERAHARPDWVEEKDAYNERLANWKWRMYGKGQYEPARNFFNSFGYNFSYGTDLPGFVGMKPHTTEVSYWGEGPRFPGAKPGDPQKGRMPTIPLEDPGRTMSREIIPSDIQQPEYNPNSFLNTPTKAKYREQTTIHPDKSQSYTQVPYAINVGDGWESIGESGPTYSQRNEHPEPVNYNYLRRPGHPTSQIKMGDDILNVLHPKTKTPSFKRGGFNDWSSYETGGVNLPGGKMSPIPGSDAVEFSGNSHDQGGIMLDPMTEVEGGETMDQVEMKKGGKRDYFFSKYLKKDGKPYAEHHKDILENGGGQEEINMLARMQEHTAGRPSQVAQTGGVKKYQGDEQSLREVPRSDRFSHGNIVKSIKDQEAENQRVANLPGARSPHSDKFSYGNIMDNIQPALAKDLTDRLIPSTRNQAIDYLMSPRGLTPLPSRTEGHTEYDQPSGVGQYTMLPSETTQMFNPGYNTNLINQSHHYLDLISEDRNSIITPGKSEENKENEKNKETKKTKSKVKSTEPDDSVDKLPLRELSPFEINVDKSLADPSQQVLEGDVLNDKTRRNLKKRDYLTMAAGAAQLIPAIAAYADKPDYMKQARHIPGIKPVELERVNFNEERSRNSADQRAMNKAIETSGGGPASIVNKMAAYRRKQVGDMSITSQEARMNTQIDNTEEQLRLQTRVKNADIAAGNVRNEMVVDEFNTGADAATKDRKLGAIQSGVQSLAGMNRDRLQYNAQERLAQAISGNTGVYDREQTSMDLINAGYEKGSKEYNDMMTQLEITRTGKDITAAEEAVAANKKDESKKDPLSDSEFIQNTSSDITISGQKIAPESYSYVEGGDGKHYYKVGKRYYTRQDGKIQLVSDATLRSQASEQFKKK